METRKFQFQRIACYTKKKEKLRFAAEIKPLNVLPQAS